MHNTEIIILGGGLAGLTLALALDKHGISTVVVDPADPAKTLSDTFDGRASAIASASWRMLEQAFASGTQIAQHLLQKLTRRLCFVAAAGRGLFTQGGERCAAVALALE